MQQLVLCVVVLASCGCEVEGFNNYYSGTISDPGDRLEQNNFLQNSLDAGLTGRAAEDCGMIIKNECGIVGDFYCNEPFDCTYGDYGPNNGLPEDCTEEGAYGFETGPSGWNLWKSLVCGDEFPDDVPPPPPPPPPTKKPPNDSCPYAHDGECD
eukprot:SAG11_NODE_15300_length_582_cov_1.832298_1_plen_153_part_01